MLRFNVHERLVLCKKPVSTNAAQVVNKMRAQLVAFEPYYLIRISGWHEVDAVMDFQLFVFVTHIQVELDAVVLVVGKRESVVHQQVAIATVAVADVGLLALLQSLSVHVGQAEVSV